MGEAWLGNWRGQALEWEFKKAPDPPHSGEGWKGRLGDYRCWFLCPSYFCLLVGCKKERTTYPISFFVRVNIYLALSSILHVTHTHTHTQIIKRRLFWYILHSNEFILKIKNLLIFYVSTHRMKKLIPRPPSPPRARRKTTTALRICNYTAPRFYSPINYSNSGFHCRYRHCMRTSTGLGAGGGGGLRGRGKQRVVITSTPAAGVRTWPKPAN